jgi:hypothetical protein
VVNNTTKMKIKFEKTLSDLATRLCVDRSTLFTWRKKPGFPKKTKRGWPIEKVRQWRFDWYQIEENELSAGPVSPWLEKYRQEKTMLLRLERLNRMGLTRPAAEVQELLSVISARLRSALQQLAVEFGSGPRDLMVECLDDMEREFEAGRGLEHLMTVDVLLDRMNDGELSAGEPADQANKKRKKNAR